MYDQSNQLTGAQVSAVLRNCGVTAALSLLGRRAQRRVRAVEAAVQCPAVRHALCGVRLVQLFVCAAVQRVHRTA